MLLADTTPPEIFNVADAVALGATASNKVIEVSAEGAQTLGEIAEWLKANLADL